MIAALFVETGGRPSVAERLHAGLHKDEATGCLLWTGSIKANGYGQIAVAASRPAYTHRVAWALRYGEIPKGLCVLHRCDTPACCNIEHLFLGTRADNNADMDAKGRARRGVTQSSKTHCKHGHPFSEDNTRHRDGKRLCRACAREWMQRARAAGGHK